MQMLKLWKKVEQTAFSFDQLDKKDKGKELDLNYISYPDSENLRANVESDLKAITNIRP